MPESITSSEESRIFEVSHHEFSHLLSSISENTELKNSVTATQEKAGACLTEQDTGPDTNKDSLDLLEGNTEISEFVEKLQSFLQQEDVKEFFRLVEELPKIADENKPENNKGHTRNSLLEKNVMKAEEIASSLKLTRNCLISNLKRITKKYPHLANALETKISSERAILKKITEGYPAKKAKKLWYESPVQKFNGVEISPNRGKLFSRGASPDRGV